MCVDAAVEEGVVAFGTKAKSVKGCLRSRVGFGWMAYFGEDFGTDMGTEEGVGWEGRRAYGPVEILYTVNAKSQ